MADWSKLPYDIIHKVSTYLVVIEDFLAFSAVCNSWHSVYVAKQWHPRPQVPMLMFSDYENSSFRSFISLYRNKVYNLELPEVHGRRCWGSSLGWLLTIGDDLKIRLLNPFTRVSVSLPSKSSLQIHFGEILDWYDIIQKAFIFRNPCTSGRNEEDLVVLIIYGPLKQLALCRPGYSSWRSIKEANHAGFIDVACLKDQIFALRDMGTLVVVDIESLAVVDVNGQRHPQHVALSLLPQWDWEQLFLVESCGDLWIVYQYHCNSHRRYHSIESIEFLIYSFDFSKKQWIRLSSLGNRAVFVGDHCSVATCASDFLNCKGDCVYFVGARTEQRWPYSDVHVDLGVYSMVKGSCKRLGFGADAPKCYSFPLWVTPTLY
ncbi:hypothetical protein C2S52_010846 [Perilla frutescens var. hirtella]|nr:hypothetical protein C2S52_010846 [Perilla frutescens var. hirtella]KAH6817660.1 hypothetical protein C2S51_001263 [Perilla frutescens var. frutescens]